MKILVVDDDLVTRKLLEKVLTKQGYEVAQVTDGPKALEMLDSNAYRIVITDWMMPSMDGPTLCRNIRCLHRDSYVYIILLTSKNAKEDTVAGLESGADDFISKPFDRFELIARIKAGRRLVELEDTSRLTQLKLARSEKAAALGHLAAGVAHEINNPIGFISSNINSLSEYLPDIKSILGHYRELTQRLNRSIVEKKLDPEIPSIIKKTIQAEEKCQIEFVLQDADDLINDCSNGAQRIKSIVHEMRYFAHPEKQVIEPCRLDEILEKVVNKFLPRLPSGATIDCSNHHLPVIECNASHIEQVFTNLIQNAVDAVGSRGRISISGNCRNNVAEIKVADTGRGIAQDHLTKVFDPFFTTKEVGQGVGLGLTSALNIIKMHNGTITCESSPGRETCFTVSLPIGGEAVLEDVKANENNPNSI